MTEEMCANMRGRGIEIEREREKKMREHVKEKGREVRTRSARKRACSSLLAQHEQGRERDD